jgi:hypothetical protein
MQTQKICASCPPSCLTCWSPYLCQKCWEGYSLSNFTCGLVEAGYISSYHYFSVSSNLWPENDELRWKLPHLSHWIINLVSSPLGEMVSCIVLDFDPKMYPVLIYNRIYSDYMLHCESNPQRDNLLEGSCDKSCLLCTRGLSRELSVCLQCSLLLLDAEIIGDKCACVKKIFKSSFQKVRSQLSKWNISY